MSIPRAPAAGGVTTAHPMPRIRTAGVVLLLLLLLSLRVASAQSAPAADAFEDPTAEALFRSAQTNWLSLDESVVRYTALIKQRIAAAIRTPLKDRTLYRSEVAVRAFWDRDHDAILQVLGSTADHPGRKEEEERWGDDAFRWLSDMPFDEPFKPGGDRLFFGMTDQDEDIYSPNNEDFWFAHPLALGADTLYRYRSGDTLTVSLPDGRRLRTIQLDVLPREQDVHRISGTLWIEPGEGALVRAVYRLSRKFDVMRDVPEVREEEEAGEYKMVPGFLKPWTFELSMVAVEYSLWNFKVWLPRTMRLEGEAAAGVMKFPVSMDMAYDLESVTTDEDVVAERERAAGGEEGEGLIERHFDSRAEAMAFLASLLTDPDGARYRAVGVETRILEDGTVEATDTRHSRYLAPVDLERLGDSPDLPPPIWSDAPGFASEEELAEMVDALADLPPVPVQGIPWNANWGWARQDLLRYNRVEGPAIGGRFEAEVGTFLGPLELTASGFFGFADLEPKARLDLERASVRRRVTLGGYRELRTADRAGRALGMGNSVNALLFGRDDGEYFLATGADLLVRPPEASRQSYELRLYAERHDAVSNHVDFALFRALDGEGTFRDNLQATNLEEAGGELTLSPWWGSDPHRPQFGLELYGQGGAWRAPDSTATRDYARASAVLRLAVPLDEATWRIGVEAGAGQSWGDAPIQRSWFLGGPANLRGFDASTMIGPGYTRGRLEVARVFPEAVAVSVFGDVGWAGVWDDFEADALRAGVGIGGSVLDGLIRMDISQGVRGPFKRFRVDLYLDAIL